MPLHGGTSRVSDWQKIADPQCTPQGASHAQPRLLSLASLVLAEDVQPRGVGTSLAELARCPDSDSVGAPDRGTEHPPEAGCGGAISPQ